MSLHYYIVTSGWHYDHWQDRFYKGIYIYFNNDAEAFAVRSAITLRGYLEERG